MPLYLTNAASINVPLQAGPGTVWAAMVNPPLWLSAFAFRLPTAAMTGPGALAFYEGFRRGAIDAETYLTRAGIIFAARAESGELSPGWLGETCLPPNPDRRLVLDGDTLVCTCPRPGSPRRKHRCHLEELAPALQKAGWSVVLYGCPLSSLPESL